LHKPSEDEIENFDQKFSLNSQSLSDVGAGSFNDMDKPVVEFSEDGEDNFMKAPVQNDNV
jgi:hypothetical protein